MKHVFILNPVAGLQKAEKRILPRIIDAVKAEDVSYEIHRTVNVGDAENYVRKRCRTCSGDGLRFYAVGGDGTLNEVVNGAYGFSNVEVGFIPAGTGNDFARIFTNPHFFHDIKRQIGGTAKKIDLISYGDKIIVNMLNIGLDCAVVKNKEDVKRKYGIRGPLAYIAGVGIVFVSNQGFPLKVTTGDGREFNEEFTLVAVGNGAYCGGGFKGVPKASVVDGLLDVSLIRKVRRRTFAALISKYRKGTHLESAMAQDIISYIKCKSLIIEPPEYMDICVDGEVFSSGRLELSILPSAISFSLPYGCEFI
ncbi:MAG TPA: diacylglycerol kinase family protein [Anaerovoracaceae bacterium]|nr:diacylglycerol kinase family protein [Anaerovoracaceae bacterium]